MCDTFFVKHNGTAFFGKNSDRSCNEPNLTVFIPRTQNTERIVKLTYVSIPQVAVCNAVMLIKPSWTFGAEMGVNEHGVAIGNEAVFTRNKSNKIPSIIGMDYLRLALERGNSAEQCCQVITDLLLKYGQGGNCGFDKNFYYDNSYLVADVNRAFILQTIGKEYVIQEVFDQANISNRLSLGTKYYIERNNNALFTSFSGAKLRQSAVKTACQNVTTLSQAFDVLRQHNPKHTQKLWDKGSVSSVCMHQSSLGDQTTGSYVVEIGSPVIWTTGCSLPCLSVYKPVFFKQPYAPCFENEQRSFAYWLEREYLLRAIGAGLIDESQYKNKMISLQESFISGYAKLNLEDYRQVADFCTSCHYAEQKMIDNYADEIQKIRTGRVGVNSMWKKYNKRLGKNAFYVSLTDRKV